VYSKCVYRNVKIKTTTEKAVVFVFSGVFLDAKENSKVLYPCRV